MKTGQVTQDFMITRDTLRHYIKEGLLSPRLVKGKYDWSEKDLEDLETILGLRQMGLSLRAISRIKYLHENACSTSEQWLENQRVFEEEIQTCQDKIEILLKQKSLLEEVLTQINQKLEKPDN